MVESITLKPLKWIKSQWRTDVFICGVLTKADGTNRTPSSYERIIIWVLFFSSAPHAALDRFALERIQTHTDTYRNLALQYLLMCVVKCILSLVLALTHLPCHKEPGQLGEIWRHPHVSLDVRHGVTSSCWICLPSTKHTHTVSPPHLKCEECTTVSAGEPFKCE